MDANEFIRNCNAHTLEELAPYEEHYVAWSEDGKRILAAARTEAELFEEIDRQALKQYVVGFISNPDISYLGGLLDNQDVEIASSSAWTNSRQLA